MHIDDAALAGALGQLAQLRFEQMDMRDAFAAVVTAMPKLFGVDGAGILILDDQQALRYVASSDEGAHILESVQETTGHGPCVTALIEDAAVVVEDIQADPRWPDLGDILAPNGIRSVLGTPVHVAAMPIGSLNVYHRDIYAWDASDVDALLAFDQLAERLLAEAYLAQRNESLIQQLNQALTSRITIDRAVGMLMAVEGLDAADAFERIRRHARSTRRPIRDVAGDILVDRALGGPLAPRPEAHPPAP